MESGFDMNVVRGKPFGKNLRNNFSNWVRDFTMLALISEWEGSSQLLAKSTKLSVRGLGKVCGRTEGIIFRFGRIWRMFALISGWERFSRIS